jgi:hypothetical protein
LVAGAEKKHEKGKLGKSSLSGCQGLLAQFLSNIKPEMIMMIIIININAC